MRSKKCIFRPIFNVCDWHWKRKNEQCWVFGSAKPQKKNVWENGIETAQNGQHWLIKGKSTPNWWPTIHLVANSQAPCIICNIIFKSNGVASTSTYAKFNPEKETNTSINHRDIDQWKSNRCNTNNSWTRTKVREYLMHASWKRKINIHVQL